MPKLQTQKNESYYVTIPKTIIKKLGWKAGDEIFVSLLDQTNLRLERLEE